MLKHRDLAFCAFLLSGIFLLPDSASAQISKLDNTSAQIAAELRPLKPKHVAVADFSSPDASISPSLGHYLALLLSELLRQHEKKHFDVLDHTKFDGDLARLQITRGSPDFAQALENLPKDASKNGADIVILGKAVRREGNCELEITPVRQRDGTVLKSQRLSLKLSEFLESFAAPFPAPEFQPV